MNLIKNIFITIVIFAGFYGNSACMSFQIPDSEMLPFKNHLAEKFKIVSREIGLCSEKSALNSVRSYHADKLDVELDYFCQECELLLFHSRINKKLEHLLSCDLCLKFVFLVIQGAFNNKKDITSELIMHKLDIQKTNTRSVFRNENKRKSMIKVFNMLAVRWARFDFYCRENGLLMQEYRALCSGQKREPSEAFYDAYQKASLYGFESICLIDQISGLDGIGKIKLQERFKLIELLEKNTRPDVLASKKEYLKKVFEDMAKLMESDREKKKLRLGFILNLFGDIRFELVLETFVLIW